MVGAIVAVNSAGRTFDPVTGDFFAGYIAATGDATDPAPAPAPEAIAFSEVPSRPPEVEARSDAATFDAALPEPVQRPPYAV